MLYRYYLNKVFMQIFKINIVFVTYVIKDLKYVIICTYMLQQ